MTPTDNAPQATPARPALAFRVGVTGARDLPADQLPRIRVGVDAILELVRSELSCLARMTEVRDAYRADPPALHLLSPLAEGADRLVAQAALALDGVYRLHVPMPFPRCEYRNDFVHADPAPGRGRANNPLPAPPGDGGTNADTFDRLLAQAASKLELDGGRDDPANDRYDEARSYEAVGRLVVRNCDLLIAIWDGKPGKGRGGTADTVRFAANFGPPVWWIHADRDQAPVWVDTVFDLRAPPRVDAAATSLRDHLTRLIVPPHISPPHPHSVFERAVNRLRPTPPAPFAAWLAEKPLPSHWLWTAYGRLLRFASGLAPPWTSPKPPDDPTARHWFDLYRPADERAGDYAARYRSVYVWVFALASLSLVFAAAALAAGHEAWLKFVMTALECVSLGMIVAFVVANLWRDWHPRWIDYRLLAELCRKQQALAPVGWSLPTSAVQELTEQPTTDSANDSTVQDAPSDRTAWVAWYFAALMRAAPLPDGSFDLATKQRAREIALADLVCEQWQYHHDRHDQYEKASRFLIVWGEYLFVAVLALILLKLVILAVWGGSLFVTVMGLLAAIVPAAAAASVGIRAYAELQLLAGQSRHMARAMQAAELQIHDLDLSHPLASQELGSLVFGVATLMLEDVQGWARLFRVKLVETG
jgi:hypothetical protein